MNNKQIAQNRISKLKKEIDYHRHLYHVLDKQEISEAALDSLKHELALLEETYPEFITPDSPTQRIGGQPLDKFQKITHIVKQWSFNDAFNETEVLDFDKRLQKILFNQTTNNDTSNLEYVAELKIDGLHVVLTYKNGLLQHGATRGDGKIGEDVTQNLKTIESIPLKLTQAIDIVVEGEVFMPKDVFNELNNEKASKGEATFANPRNSAAGAIRQLDPKIVQQRKLACFIYDLSLAPHNLTPNTQAEELQLLKDLGFKVNNHWQHLKNITEAFQFWKTWSQQKEEENYWIDGVVLKLNRRDLQEKAGYTGKAPRWAIAYKFPAIQTTTTIKDIKLQIGRTGALTPVAHLQPVSVAGSRVTKATLHNLDEIQRLDVRIGDTVVIQKAGDIIPEVVSVIKGLRNGQEIVFQMPSNCPFCQLPIKRHPQEVAYYCTNPKCLAIKLRQINHFVSKKGLNIEGLGPKKIKKLVEAGLITSIIDIFKLQSTDLQTIEGFQDKSIQNLLNAIQHSKNTSLDKLIYALGIRYVGEESAFSLAQNFSNLSEMSQTSLDDWLKIAGVGEKVAQSLYNYFQDPQNQQMIQTLIDLGVTIHHNTTTPKSSKITNLNFVITGTLDSLSRSEMENLIHNLGGHTTNTVSSKVHYIIVGHNPGNKLTQAQKLNISILSEKDFQKLIS